MKTIILGLALLSAGALQAAPIVILNDQFLDNNRTSQSLPDSSAWYYLGGSGSMTVTDHKLNWNVGGGWASALTYFSASAVTLDVGDALTASFSLAFDNIGSASLAESLRIGLFNSGSNRVTGDVPASRFNNAFNNYTGYYGGLNPLSNAGNTFFSRRRAAISSTDLFSASAVWLGPSVNSVIFQEDVPLLVSLSAERLVNGVKWTVSIGGVVQQSVDVGSTLYAFDTLALFVGGPTNTAQNLLISNVNVVLTPAPIPEPGSVALALIAGGGLFLMGRGRGRGKC